MTTARVILVLDASAAMLPRYRDGSLGPAVERVTTVAARFGSDPTISAFRLTEFPKYLPEVDVSDVPGWVQANVAAHADGPPDPQFFGFRSDESAVMEQVRLHVESKNRKRRRPTLVVVFSGGGGSFVDATKRSESWLAAATAAGVVTT